MLDKMTDQLGFHAKALVLRAERQRALASNIANADTPGYVARDFSFSEAMGNAMQGGASGALSTSVASSGSARTVGRTDSRHMALTAGDAGGPGGRELGYSVQSQPNLDNSTVDLDRERANFVDNAVRYEATLRFINGQAKTLLSAIQGQ
jgi:flagellar basal-body rod protein FlgB